MGDRWILTLKCANCGKENREIWYAPTCNCTEFTCRWCGVNNKIIEKFTTEVADDQEEKET